MTKKGNIIHKQEKCHSIETNPEITELIELADKDIVSYFKYAPYLNMLKKIRGKHNHDKERNRRYKKNPIYLQGFVATS